MEIPYSPLTILVERRQAEQAHQFQEAFKKYQAHWIYSLRKRDFVRP